MMILKSKFKLAALVGFSLSVVFLLVHLLVANYLSVDLIQYHPTMDDFFIAGQANITLLHGLFLQFIKRLMISRSYHHHGKGYSGAGICQYVDHLLEESLHDIKKLRSCNSSWNHLGKLLAAVLLPSLLGRKQAKWFRTRTWRMVTEYTSNEPWG